MSPPFQLLVATTLPIAAIYSLIGGGRLVRWLSEQRSRPQPPEPVERMRADLIRRRSDHEALENPRDLPAKNLRLRAHKLRKL